MVVVGNIAVILGLTLTVLNITVIFARPLMRKNKEFEKRRGYLENDYDDIQELKESIYYLQICVLLMLNHFIEGNGIEEMKKTRNDMQEKMFKKPVKTEDRK